jgi:glycosyltransferase involved in cell wall biosynthesis
VSVSVILVTYGRAELLGATIESILDQTLRDFELVISDDCSPDSTEAVCRTFARRDHRVRYRRNEARLQMPGNVNAALREVQGDLIATLHDGDLYDRSLLERWRDALVACRNAAFVFNAYNHLGADGSVRTTTREHLPTCFPGRVLLEDICFRRWRFGSPVWGTVMARRSAYEAVGPFDERFGFYADVDMWMRLAEQFPIAYVNEPLITLPSRDVAPRLFSIPPCEESRTVRQIFWEARMRHYRDRPFRRTLEVGRHAAFTASAVAADYALDVRRKLWSQRGRASRDDDARLLVGHVTAPQGGKRHSSRE